MLKSYLTIALRSLWKNRLHTFINILGLSLGVASCVLIVLFVKDEWTFDTFHAKADRIYRVYVKENWGKDQEFFNTVTPYPMGPALVENFEEVEKQVRILNTNGMVKRNDELLTETLTIAGQDFFSVFDFEIIRGSKKNALAAQNGIVLTETLATKYFGEVDPVGKGLSIQVGPALEEFEITAVVKDLPTNSSIQFGILLSDLFLPKIIDAQTLTSGWFNVNPETYVLLREGTNATELESKFPAVFKGLLGEAEFNQSKYQPGLQALTSIHLDTSFPAGIAPVSNSRYAFILAAIALLILLVACINFITLSIGRSIKRAKEVGIRKVVGAIRQQLIFQFIGEAFMITLASLLIGYALAFLNLPFFNDLSGKQLSMNLDGFTILFAFLLLGIIGLMAGSYPAFVLSAFKPIAILKGHVSAGNNKQTLRKVLVGIQLVLSIFLVSSTLIMQDQLSLLQNKNLGFNKEQLAIVPLSIPRGGGLSERVQKGFDVAEQFKIELAKIPNIQGVCSSSHDFGNGAWVALGYTDENNVYRNFSMNVVDDEYVPVMKMELAEGRNFSDAVTADKRRSVLVNEAFVKEYGWTSALGKRIPGKGFGEHEIIGVVKDFNFASLYTRVQPLVMVQDPGIIMQGVQNISIDNSPMPKLVMRLKPGEMMATLDEVKEVWSSLSGGAAFNFTFVDQAMQNQYKSEFNLGKIVNTATILAVVIGSLGLYGLALLSMQSRIKEISIRKVLGATEKSLLVLLSKEYVGLVMVCLVFSIPVTYYLMEQWLVSFEYRISIGVSVFLMAGGLSLLVALLTIATQTIKTTLTQPAETLRCD